MRNILAFLLVAVMLRQTLAGCPAECDCSGEPTGCPIGVSLVVDGCNCCRVCARQAGETCNYLQEICDSHRGLFCDYSNVGENNGGGLCAAQSGQPCWHDQARIPSGAMFEPSCRMRCWCLDGDIGCIPQCPHEVQAPRADACTDARLMSVPGECCDQWVCSTESGDRILPADQTFWRDLVDNQPAAVNVSDLTEGLGFLPDADPLTTNVARDMDFYDGDGEWTDGDELIDYQLSYINEPDLPDDAWSQTNLIPVTKVDVATSVHQQRSRPHCTTRMSLWSACSKTCGLGISTRVANLNTDCRLKREIRLCIVRPCDQNQLFKPKHGRRCSKFRRSPKRVHVNYAGCQSVRRLRLKYCGLCLDQDRCCTPRHTRTANVRFECPSGARFNKNLMMISNCRCHRNCLSANQLPSKSRVSYRNMPVDS